MKKIFLLSAILGYGMIGVTTLASEYETKSEVTVAEGEFLVSFPSGKLEFPKIKERVLGNALYHPTISKTNFLTKMDPDLYSTWFGGNPLDKDYSEPQISPPEPSWGEILYSIGITNTSNVMEWRVKLSRTPMTNEEGQEISNDKFFIGEILDYNNVGKDSFNKDIISDGIIVTNEKQTVAEFSGDNAKKIHNISPFGSIKFNPDNPSDELLTIKNIGYGVMSSTNIPSSGNYSSSLIWTIEKGPDSEAL